MKIAITADPFLPVPPMHYGGIERIIAMLINVYTDAGHEVTLFGHRESVTSAELMPYFSDKSGLSAIWQNAWLIQNKVDKNEFDIIHSFGRMAYLLPLLRNSIPKLMSYQRNPTVKQVKRACAVSKRGTLTFTGCSDHISNLIRPYAPCETIYNCTDGNLYQFAEHVDKDAPLAFLGRIEPIKGAHLAIELARKSDRRLVIAGNISAEHTSYFRERIEPHLGSQISYIGVVNDEQKNELLGKALALIFPIQWEEPFGIVMVESMACGTPVLAIGRGAVPEVITPGKGGYYARDITELLPLVETVGAIPRQRVRALFEERFSVNTVANRYLSLYHNLIC